MDNGPDSPKDMEPRSTKRRNSVDLVVDNIALYTESFRTQLRSMIMGLGMYSAIASVLPVMFVVWSAHQYNTEFGELIFGPGNATIEAPIYGPTSASPNITSVPMGLDEFNKFFTDTQDDPHNRQWIFMLIFQAALYGTTIIRALVLFNPSTLVGRAVPVLAYVLMVAWLARLFGAMAYQSAVDGEYSEENLGILNLTIVVFAVFPPVLMTLTLGLSSFASPYVPVQRVPP
jgi:hypothetical protein